MFEQIQSGFGTIIRTLRGLGKITEENIVDSGRKIRRALLQADVNHKVAREFVDRISKKAEGSPVLDSVMPGQQFVRIIRDELASLLGDHWEGLREAESPPTVILMAGLQGSGKTTTAAKLAYYLKNEGKKPYLVAADVYRPAAVDQLKSLAGEMDVPVWDGKYRDPVKICRDGLQNAAAIGCDVVIMDTAGRLHVDSEMMDEIAEIAVQIAPHEILFVADGMTGQDAVKSAGAFSAALDVTGIILTKMDGDARGGAALSIKAVTGIPIKFIGTHERPEGLEPFHPERMADRILGMGDIVSLVEKMEKVVDRKQAHEAAEKIQKQQLTLEDFQRQLKQVRRMGSLDELIGMIPGIGRTGSRMVYDEKRLIWTDAIISSMTPQERANPSIIDGRRRRRIARGSGRTVQEVNQLLKEFSHLKRMTKDLSRLKINRKMMDQVMAAFK
ncbi:MAG: signal recognition particle protein [Candidatus Neomarinimicrobiota bacterium]